MKKHRYRVTLEHLTDTKGAPSIHGPLQFEMANHDDIMVIIEWLRNRDDFTQEMAASFGVGLKLFSEVMLENKGHPLFTPFMPHFIQFMKELKKDAGKT